MGCRGKIHINWYISLFTVALHQFLTTIVHRYVDRNGIRSCWYSCLCSCKSNPRHILCSNLRSQMSEDTPLCSTFLRSFSLPHGDVGEFFQHEPSSFLSIALRSLWHGHRSWTMAPMVSEFSCFPTEARIYQSSISLHGTLWTPPSVCLK